MRNTNVDKVVEIWRAEYDRPGLFGERQRRLREDWPELVMFLDTLSVAVTLEQRLGSLHYSCDCLGCSIKRTELEED